jgi:prepilin-type processing-associated H-X9-DG protein
MTNSREDASPPKPASLDYGRTTARSTRELNGVGIASCAFGVIAAITFAATIPHSAKGEGNVPLLVGLLLTLCSIVFAIAAFFRTPRNREFYSPMLGVLAVAFAVFALVRLEESVRLGSNRVPCASNLRHIGLAVLLYAEANGGRLPASLEDLAIAGDITPETLICPESHDKPAMGKGTALATALKKPGHNSYIYLGTGRAAAEFGSGDLLAYDFPSNHGGVGVNALFGDGHVEYLSRTGLQTLLARTRASTRPSTLPQP